MSRRGRGRIGFAPPTVSYRAWLGLLGFVSRIDVTLKGVGNIPGGRCIVVSNHPGREEVALAYLVFRRPIRIMVDRQLLDPDYLFGEFQKAISDHYRFPKWFNVLGRVITDWLARQYRSLGCIPVVRNPDSAELDTVNRRAFRETIKALKRDEVIGMAPEGTLSVDGKIGELQKGAAQIAWYFARRGEPVPVIPMIFSGITELNQSLFSRTRVVIAVGEPFHMEIEPGKGRKEVLEHFTEMIRKSLNNLNDSVSHQSG